MQGKSAAVVAQHVLIKLGAFMTIYLPMLLAVIAVDNWAPKDTRHRVVALIAAVLLGGIVGSLLSYGAHLFLDPKQLFDPEVYSGTMTLRERVGGWVEKSFLAALATTVYFLVVREDEAHTALHREKMDRLSLEREMTEAQLQVMQAQIEPHFLFNTLANVRRLYQTDAPMGRAMLQHLSRYSERRAAADARGAVHARSRTLAHGGLPQRPEDSHGPAAALRCRRPRRAESAARFRR